MRKNLFLTLALAFATLAGVNAQDWSVTYSAADGLPGVETKLAADGTEAESGGVSTVFQTDVITPDAPLSGLRITFVENNGTEYLGKYPILALSELVVYAADGKTVIPYTVESNADHNTIAAEADGQGLDALKDGKWNNYWQSLWGDENKSELTGYPYLDLTLEQEVDAFIVKWATRQGATHQAKAPKTVGFTAKEVEFIPYADWAFELGEQITSMDDLLEAKYFVMKSNVPIEYHTYKNNTDGAEGKNFGDQITKEPNEGPGPRFVNAGEVAEEASPSYAIQLIPTEDADGNTAYYLYFVTSGRYLSKHPSHNKWNGANGEQGKTTVLSNAALVYIEETTDGKFEMYYMMEEEDGDEIEIHMGATPSTGGFKNVDKERYDFYKEGHPYCLNYSYIIAFDWMLYDVSMNYPDKYLVLPVKGALKEAYNIYTYMDSVAVEGYENYYNDFLDAIKEAEDALKANSYTTISEVFEDVTALNNAMGVYVWSKIERFYQVEKAKYETQYGDSLCSVNNPVEGKYTQEAYNMYITPMLARAEELRNMDEGTEYENIGEMQTFINSIENNVNNFLASKIKFITFPQIYATEDVNNTPLGKQNGNRYDWEQLIVLQDGVEVNGIRLTFLNTVGNAKFNNYPMVAISGLEIIANGEKLPLDSTCITTNSLEKTEGSIANLLDDKGNTFYHSIWNGDKDASGNLINKMDPVGYVYLDIKFPANTKLNKFTVKVMGREGQAGFRLSPSKVSVGEYGVVTDELIARDNLYNVCNDVQITDESQLKHGGLYILSGNLRVKTQDAAPRYYSGEKPYHTNIKAALNDPCVYMFKKTENGWNIISLANAQFWALNVEETENEDAETKEVTISKDWSTGLTIDPENAAEVKFAKSNNLTNTFVIYSEIGDNDMKASWSWKNENDASDSLEIAESTVNANKFVFMDWDGSLAGRPCVNELPGVFTYGADVIDAHELAEEIKAGDGYSAGDYLHFNKANGEGEWNIYEVQMDSPYYFWAKVIAENLENWGLATGNDPGCIVGDIADFEDAVEKIEAAVAEESNDAATTAVPLFYENFYMTKDVERVGIENNYWYAIESAYTEYYKQQGKIKAIYADGAGLAWKDAPVEYNEENDAFVFQFQKYGSEFLPDPDNLGITEEESEYAFRIRSGKYNAYAGTGGGTEQVNLISKVANAPVYIVKPLERNIYTIYIKGANPLHTAGHGDGAGNYGNIVNWGGEAGSASSWVLRFVDDADETNSISDLVVEGDEVVSVAYFTPAGAAIPAPVSGINIVVTVYSNGVIETKKVLVK